MQKLKAQLEKSEHEKQRMSMKHEQDLNQSQNDANKEIISLKQTNKKLGKEII